ncbi:hypothetical protein Z043_115864 [Scleropages formosus]|uniref:Uncharacterized protein n=1 Tax=Scleropages formosus TaxID=113540 RepID=A0A0P7WVK1_SCLFO|nr:hypothetical protein Z043_115864 [Scleropages formosus]
MSPYPRDPGQATLVSELSRFEAELDSDIQGLERRLSQKQHRRARGEVLIPPKAGTKPRFGDLRSYSSLVIHDRGPSGNLLHPNAPIRVARRF